MAKYYVRYNDLQTQAASLQNISKTLTSFESRLNSIASAMDGRDSNMATLRTQVKNCGKVIPVISQKVSTTSSTLVSIIVTTQITHLRGTLKSVNKGEVFQEDNAMKPLKTLHFIAN